MRYIRIFLLYLQDLFAHRSRSLVWFIISLFNPLVLILLWKGTGKVDNTFTPSMITSYYLTLVLADAVLMSHIEDEVSTEDIFEGRLLQYLLRPFPYYWFKWFNESSYRLLMGTYGLIVLVTFTFIFGNFIRISADPVVLVLAGVGFLLGFFLCFTFKMLLGITGFWLRDNQATFQLVDAMIIVFAGYVIPLQLMPPVLVTLSHILPFAYMVYYPIILFQGTLPLSETIHVLSIQALWLAIMYGGYHVVWQLGLRKFSGIGQ